MTAREGRDGLNGGGQLQKDQEWLMGEISERVLGPRGYSGGSGDRLGESLVGGMV